MIKTTEVKPLKDSGKIIGDFGELLMTLLLYQDGINAHWVGFSNLSYDIIVPFPDDNIFKKIVAISVKTRNMEKNGRTYHLIVKIS